MKSACVGILSIMQDVSVYSV